jgi:hypothetical protein
MEDLIERAHCLIGTALSKFLEEILHRGLPSCVHLRRIHRRPRGLEVVAFEVADEQSVVAQEQRVVVPPCGAERSLHVGPDLLMAAAIFRDPILTNMQHEADSRHRAQNRTTRHTNHNGRGQVFRIAPIITAVRAGNPGEQLRG